MPHCIISQIAHFLKVIKSETGFLATAPSGKMTAKSQNEDEFKNVILQCKHNPLNGPFNVGTEAHQTPSDSPGSEHALLPNAKFPKPGNSACVESHNLR